MQITNRVGDEQSTLYQLTRVSAAFLKRSLEPELAAFLAELLAACRTTAPIDILEVGEKTKALQGKCGQWPNSF